MSDDDSGEFCARCGCDDAVCRLCAERAAADLRAQVAALQAEKAELRAAVAEGALGCCGLTKEELRADIAALTKRAEEAEQRADGNFASYERVKTSLSALTKRAEELESALFRLLVAVETSISQMPEKLPARQYLLSESAAARAALENNDGRGS